MGGQSFICALCGKFKVGDGRGHLKNVHGITNIPSAYAFNKVYPFELRQKDELKCNVPKL